MRGDIVSEKGRRFLEVDPDELDAETLRFLSRCGTKLGGKVHGATRRTDSDPIAEAERALREQEQERRRKPGLVDDVERHLREGKPWPQ